MREDSWKDGYDTWKLAPPYDDESECDHEDYEVDILDGRCRCTCGHSWCAGNEEIVAEIERQRAYSEWEGRESRRQWWGDLLYSVRHPLQAIHWQLQKRGWLQRRATPADDEIPF